MTAPTYTFLGIAGVTPGALVIAGFIAVFGSGGILVKWITSMADRKRATNEGVTAESKSSEAQFVRLEREIKRLTERVTAQDERIDKLEHDLIECERRHAEAETEIKRMKAIEAVIGDSRQLEQLAQSATSPVRAVKGEAK